MKVKRLQLKVKARTGKDAECNARILAEYIKINLLYVVATNVSRPQPDKPYALLSVAMKSPNCLVGWWRSKQVFRKAKSSRYGDRVEINQRG